FHVTGVQTCALPIYPIQKVLTYLPGDDEDQQARYLEATIAGLRVASIYLPNGNPAPGEKFDYKLAWMERLRERAKKLLESEQPRSEERRVGKECGQR